jgi:hypothetical protein
MWLRKHSTTIPNGENYPAMKVHAFETVKVEPVIDIDVMTALAEWFKAHKAPKSLSGLGEYVGAQLDQSKAQALRRMFDLLNGRSDVDVGGGITLRLLNPNNAALGGTIEIVPPPTMN